MSTNAIVRVPIEQQPTTGLLAVSTTVSQASTPQRLLLDTTFPSVLFTCDATRPNATCAAVCDYAHEPVIFIYPNGGNACLNAVSTAVSLGKFSTAPDFKAGPIARLKKTNVLGPQKATTFDGVLGIGLPELPRHPTVPTLLSGNLAKLWGTYSLVVASLHSAKHDDSYLLIGGMDETLVSSRNLIAHEAAALPEIGWTLDLRGVFVGSRASGVCESGCMAMINTASAVIRIPAPAWKELEATLNDKCVDVEDLGDELVHSCDKDV
ncbi:hypothetical protein PINS_up000815 [Pythium insidiosum]|nr:hypothetical protein PINS_up000815 [Pythium insidiosum]